MPKSKHRKRKPNSKRTPIAGHRRTGKELIPPFVHFLGDKAELTSWLNDRLPEMLWASLILVSTTRTEAFQEFSRVINFVSGHGRKGELGDLTITGIAELDSELREELIACITSNPATSKAMATMLIFESLPAKEDWDKYVGSEEPSLNLLMAAVGQTLSHQSPTSTDCRWVRVTGMAAAGKFSASKEMSDYVERMTKYPNLEPGSPEGATVRATEQALVIKDHRNPEWASNFWQEAWTKTPCFHLGTATESDNIPTSTTRPRLNEIVELLREHWALTHSTTAVDAKHDAVFGMTFYALRILLEMMTVGISSSVIGRLALRTLLEQRINLKHLIDVDDPELWRKWRQYGSGQAKLASLKLDESRESPQYVDEATLEIIASEDLWEEYLSINIGNWANEDLRKLSERTQLKDTYDQYYPWTSTYSHGAWGAIRETSFHTCGNPLHRLHRIPRNNPIPDCLNDAVILVDEIFAQIDSEYPTFPHRLMTSE